MMGRYENIYICANDIHTYRTFVRDCVNIQPLTRPVKRQGTKIVVYNLKKD